MEKTEVDTEVARLQMLKANYESQRYAHQDNFLFKYPKLISETEKPAVRYRKGYPQTGQ